MADIKQLSDREHCRSRCGMYLGGSSEDGSDNPESLRTAIREAVDNSKDELISGNGDTIWIYVDNAKEPLGLSKYEGKSIKHIKVWKRYTIADNASGIPIKPTKNVKGETVTMAELALGNFRAGSKFNKTKGLVGLNGVGCSATNFTSATFSCYSHMSCHDLSNTTPYVKSLIKKLGITKKNAKDYYYKVTWNLGLKESEEIVKAAKDSIIKQYWSKSELPSTITTFIPDPTIHGTTVADIPNDFEYLGYINKDFSFYINGKKVDSDIGFAFENSVTIGLHGENQKQLKKLFEREYADENDDKNPWMTWNYSFQVTKSFDDDSEDYSVNTLDCQEGKHKSIWKMCYTHAFCEYFKDWDIEKYALMGMNFLVIMQCPEPSFSSQTKERCSSVEGWGNKIDQYWPLVESITKIIKVNHDLFEQNYHRIREFYNAKQNVGKLKELQGMLGEMVDGNSKSSSKYSPRKLKDCSCTDRLKAEIFFVEGSSAAGGFVKAKTGYDNIAVMGLRGNIVNTVDMDVNDAMNNDEISDLVYTCGGVDQVHMDLDKLRFGKYIIASDADSDGEHIASLILGFILQHSSFMFGTEENDYEDSVVYRIDAPLYAFTNVNGTQDNQYFYAGEEAKMNEWKKNNKFLKYKRFKGLGELSKKELQDLYLNPEIRRLIKLKPQDVEETLALLSPYENGKQARKELMINSGVWSDNIINLTEYTEKPKVKKTVKKDNHTKKTISNNDSMLSRKRFIELCNKFNSQRSER